MDVVTFLEEPGRENFSQQELAEPVFSSLDFQL